MEVMKFKGHPLTEEQLKAVKGGAKFTLYDGEVAAVCPKCEGEIDERSLKTYVVDPATDKIIIRNYICQHCGYMGE